MSRMRAPRRALTRPRSITAAAGTIILASFKRGRSNSRLAWRRSRRTSASPPPSSLLLTVFRSQWRRARLIAKQLNHSHWFITYQSRGGKPTDLWLDPDVGALIRDLGSKGVSDIIIAPIGFVCDHVEVLYDLDIEAKQIAESSGVGFVRADCPNDHPTFIEMLAEVIQGAMKNAED